MKRSALPGLVVLLAFLSTAGAQDGKLLRRSVVKIFCTSNRLNLSSPWERGTAGESSGSGIWLGGRRILTNEHLVDYATQLSVQPNDSAERIPAEVVFASPEMDLAIIEMDEVPFDDFEPPQFAEGLPNLRSKVQVYGFPEGGHSISVTEGIVSRIEYLPYSHGAFGLRLQVDAAINPGNSGGPAYVERIELSVSHFRSGPAPTTLVT
jgi:S1-C subfamily serine protease